MLSQKDDAQHMLALENAPRMPARNSDQIVEILRHLSICYLSRRLHRSAIPGTTFDAEQLAIGRYKEDEWRRATRY
jgi:hypothetical protein